MAVNITSQGVGEEQAWQSVALADAEEPGVTARQYMTPLTTWNHRVPVLGRVVAHAFSAEEARRLLKQGVAEALEKWL